ncbi:MAG: hypothetical protein HN509_00385 [Halobacteriovoraceae bacterium]|jgi:hypothetical protein|nr:hypothetical protein [Halobacteriovoraceae bacterium]
MPILSVKALPQIDSTKISLALKKTAVAISASYGCSPENVWATWEELRSEYYTEGNNSVEVQPLETHPPICQLLCFEGKSPEVIESVLLAAAETLSTELGISNNIFISYHEAKSGQVIAGNGIVRCKN